MDARDVMKEWLGDPHDSEAPTPPDRRGREGRLLQGTSPVRYAADVADWLDFIEDTVPIGAWHTEPSHIRTWLDMRGGAARSRARRVSAVGAFYAYALHHGHVLHNPVDPRLSGKAHLTPPGQRLTESQMHLIRWAADQLEGAFAERDRLLTYLLLAGLRSRQITEFELPGVIFEQAYMSGDIWQKGGGTRRYAFPNEIRTAVRAYLPHRTWRGPHSHEERGPLLVTYRGQRLDSNTTPRTTLKTVLTIARSCPDKDAPDLPDRVTPDTVALSPGEHEGAAVATRATAAPRTEPAQPMRSTFNPTTDDPASTVPIRCCTETGPACAPGSCFSVSCARSITLAAWSSVRPASTMSTLTMFACILVSSSVFAMNIPPLSLGSSLGHIDDRW